jgi:shikimate kinase
MCFDNSQLVNLPAAAINGVTAPTIAFSLFSSAANRFLNLELSALEADGKGKIISSPRVVTEDNVMAVIEQGVELPYQQATSSGATSIAFRKANLRLEVTPQITPDGNVVLDVDVAKDSKGEEHDRRFRHQHPAREDQGHGRKRRHRGAGRYLPADRYQQRQQGAAAGRHAGARLPVQDHRALHQQDRAAGLHHAEDRVNVVSAVPTLSLTTSAGSLASAGTAGNEVTVQALVRDANNSVMPGVTVDLKSDSGSLSLTSRVTDAQGIVTEKLGTGGDATTRAIKITASVPGATPATTVVNVSGNKLTINAAATVNVGSSTDVTVKLVDSAGNALSGKTVTYTSNANALSVKGGGAAVTNAAGQLILSYAASGGSADVISVKSMGELASVGIAINSSSFAVRVLDALGNVATSAAIGGCQQVSVTGAPGASVTLSSSRGTVYSNAGCSSVLNGALALSSGAATAYVNATGPGIATLTANAGGLTAQTDLEFIAPVTALSTITVQADPAVVGVNTSGSTSQQATLRAIVRDGTAQNNLVKNATVAFSILSDPSGGSLTQPAVVTTGSDGTATTSFIAGTTATPLNGVQIQARLVGGSNATAAVSLTVAQKSLFISAGTGNTVGVPTTATYQMDYAVIVTDAAGNAVPGVRLTASVLPAVYYKGVLGYAAPSGPWQPVTRTTCANEDLNNNGILDANEDTNVGLMGAGKTTIGRLLARRLGICFVDSDHEIEARTGASIPVDLRDRGRAQLSPPRSGGDPRADRPARPGAGHRRRRRARRQQPRAAGRARHRGLPARQRDSILQRTAHDKNRPLLQTADPRKKLEDLTAQREPLYREIADLVIDTGRPNVQSMVQTILDQIAALEAARARKTKTTMNQQACTTLNVDLGDRSYPIVIGRGLLDDGALLERHIGSSSGTGSNKVAIVTNTTVAPLYLEKVAAPLRAAGRDVVPSSCRTAKNTRTGRA